MNEEMMIELNEKLDVIEQKIDTLLNEPHLYDNGEGPQPDLEE